MNCENHCFKTRYARQVDTKTSVPRLDQPVINVLFLYFKNNLNIFIFFICFKLIFFFMFLDHFDALISKIIF
jgi:hypothetical protein